MNTQRAILSIFLILNLLIIPQALGVVIGSETAVSVQPTATFPSTDTDNTMLGFGWFKNGFALQDSTTTCTFNSVYPVSGPVDLNGGTLALLQDLIFHNVTTLNGWGSLIGNNYAVDFCSSVTVLPANAKIFKDTNIHLNTDLIITSTVTLQGNCTISGCGNSIMIGSNGALVIDSNAQVVFEEMEIKGLQGSNFQCADDTGKIILSDMALELADDFIFAKGSMFLADAVTFMGTATFFYTSSQTSTIDTESTFILTNGIHLNIGRDPISGNEPLAFTDATSVLRMANCGYDIQPTGISLKKGTLFFENNVAAKINSNSFATGVTVGSGNPTDDFTVYFSPGCSISHSGHMAYNNSRPDLFNSTTNTTKLTRTANSYVLANTDFQMPQITVELVSNSVPPIAVTPGSNLSFNQSTVVLPEVTFDLIGMQLNPWTYILPGNGLVNFTKGSLPLYLVVQGSGNEIVGNGSVDGAIILNGPSATLDFGISGYLGNSLSLNGGTVSLSNDLKIYNNGIIVGPGVVEISNRILHINSGVTTWDSPIMWQANDGVISLEEQISLASTWSVQGNCIIDGNNNELVFDINGEIIVQPNSQLYLKNMRLQSIADVNIRCADETGVVVLDDVYWTQTQDFTFSSGSLFFKNDVDFVGSYTFFYESMQTSTIDIKSTLTIRDHMNLNIGKQQVVGAQEPLVMSDGTSLIIIDNAQWSIVGDGMRLTKGRVICADDVLVDISSTNSSQGLKLGDTTQAGDVTFEFRPGATVRVPRGHVVCDWYASNNVKSQSNSAQLIRSALNSFYCSGDIVLSNLTIVTEPGAPLNVAPGKGFAYSNCIFNVPGGFYTMSGQFYNMYTNLLDGNDSITLQQGIMPLYTVVSGTGNTIAGNGTVTGQIIFSDPMAQLTWTLNGMLANDAMLNGGTLILNNDMHLANGVRVHGPGEVNVSNFLFRFGAQNLSLDTPTQFNCNGGKLELKAQLSLASTWTVTGSCTIIGNGNTIDLGSAGEIVIDSNSSLSIENAIIKNVGNNNIRCVDNGGTLLLKDVVWSQPAFDYTFANGALIINNNVTMMGGTSFNYESIQTSTINSHSTWYFDSGMTFKYAPTLTLQTLIDFEDSSATLSLFETGLFIASTGMQLLKGTLVIDGICPVDIVGTNSGNGLIIGDGTSSMNDFDIVVLPESNLNITNGYFNYQNVS